ncbi:MAG: HupE/UreJ family protein [Gemmataceae bacterium]
MKSPIALALGAILIWPLVASAHPSLSPASGLAQGIAHPLSGLDHTLAMFAIGLWAAQRGGRALWAVPLAFIGVMAIGFALGSAGWTVPFAESGVVASVLIMGLFVASAVRLSTLASAGLIGVFALVHGHVHGTEMPAMALPLTWLAGFTLSTLVLLLTGVALGRFARSLNAAAAIRWTGGAVAASGLWMLLA